MASDQTLRPNPPKLNNGVGEISAEQRARISQNFRAAKALLARKRPRSLDAAASHKPSLLSNKALHENGMETPIRVKGIDRTPLSEIPANTPFPVTKFLSPLGREHTIIGGSSSNGFGLDSFITPVKQLECSRALGSFSVSRCPSYGDEEEEDDFDESILEEIDALCEKKQERPEAIMDSIVEMHRDNDNTGNGLNKRSKPSCDEEETVKATLVFGDNKELVAEELLSDSLSLKIGKMAEGFSKYMLSLNDRQREAACFDISTPLMIIAGPGSGKTSTMVGRVLMLLHEGISPSNILAMTFTTAAVAEMRERIGKVAGKAIAKELTISTFHSFSLQLCRSHAEKLGRTSEFLIYGHGQQRRAVIEAVRLLENEKSIKKNDSRLAGEESHGVTSPQHFKDMSKKWQQFVTRAKASGRTPEDCDRMGDETGAAILRNYNDILRTCNALDYHDFISCSVKLLTEYPEVLSECQDSWKSIVIDEFQDTSAMQFNLLKILASHNHITIVGDDDQSIFSFNGADTSGFDSFRKKFASHKEIRLNKNYRSTRHIVEAASSVIRNNMKRCQLKSVDTDNSSGSKIIIKECHSEDAQCAFVVDKIFETAPICSTAKESYGNIAVLYRRQVSGKVFQAAFRERKIPFNTHGVAFYRKKVVRTIISMLRTTLPGCDNTPYRRVFKALLPTEKEDKKRVIEHIDKVSTVRKCSFISAACDIFGAKVSGTFKSCPCY